MNKDNILIAKIVKPHGIKGEVKIISYAQNYKNLNKYQVFSDCLNNNYILEKIITRNKSIYLKFENCDNRTKAEKLIGLDLYVSVDKLDKAQDGEFYHYQLIGLKAVNSLGLDLGKIIDICNFGAGDLIEVGKNNSASRYLPFNKEVISEINIKENYIVIHLPEEF